MLTPLRVLTLEAFKKLDEETIALGLPSNLLMESAGQAMAWEILKRFPTEVNNALILVGPSHNGGDALVVARVLLRAGYRPTVLFCNPNQRKSTAVYLEKINYLTLLVGGKLTKDFQQFKKYDSKIKKQLKSTSLIIDGLFGVGLNKPLSGELLKLIEASNETKAIKVALDIPSGLVSLPSGGACFEADLTLTVGGYKEPFLYSWAGPYLGEVQVIPIDYPQQLLTKYSYEVEKLELSRQPQDLQQAVKTKKGLRKREYGHKLTGGRSLIIAGSHKYPGAAYLCVKAALNEGSGYLSLLSPISLPLQKAPQLMQCQTLSKVSIQLSDFEAHEKILLSSKTILIGPGLDRQKETEGFVEKVISLKDKKIIIDADGLWFLAGMLKRGWQKSPQSKLLITPHTGEFLTLCLALGLVTDFSDLQNKLVPSMNAFYQKTGICVLLKEACSFYQGDRLYYFPYPNRFLAKAGSGDILSGRLLAAMSQRLDFQSAVVEGMRNYIEDGFKIRNQKGAQAPITNLI